MPPPFRSCPEDPVYRPYWPFGPLSRRALRAKVRLPLRKLAVSTMNGGTLAACTRDPTTLT